MYYQLYILYIVVIIFLLFCIYLLWKTKRKDILINHLKLLSDYSPNPMFQLDNDRYITGCNKAFETFLWKSKEDIIGKTMFDIMDEEVARIHDEVDRDLIAKGGEIRYEGTLIHADGTSHNVILNKRLIGGVKYSGILCDIVDVSSDSQMQDQINSINDEYLMLLDNIPIQVWYLTDKETYGKINKSHASFIGLTKGDIEYKKIVKVHKKQEAAMILEDNAIVFEEKRWTVSELALTNRHGVERILSVIKTPYIDKAGQLKFVVCAAVDITEQKMIEVELIKTSVSSDQANKAKSLFLANMSHEIRTPMNAIIGFLDLLNSTSLSVVQKDYVHTIQDSSQVLLTLINDILDFSKIEADEINLEMIPFNLEYLIESALRIIRPKVQNRGVFLYYEYDKNLPKTFIGDPTRLRQVVLNLLSNADKFTEEGEIQVSIRNNNQDYESKNYEIFISVTDTGIGILEETLEKIFKSFTQADLSTTRKYGGTGLGLTICKALVEKMRGKIWVDSMPGMGSSFQFTIKLDKSNEEIDTLKPADIAAFKNIDSIIVDNNDYTRIMLEKNCREFGLHIIKSGSLGKEIIDFIKDNTERDKKMIIIADILMTDMDGLSFGKSIKKYDSNENIVLIALSTSTLPGDAKKAQDYGYDAYLPKPVLKYDLLKVLQYTIAARDRRNDSLVTRHSYKEAEFKKNRILIAEDNKVNQKLIESILVRNGFTIVIVEDGKAVLEELKERSYDLILMDIHMPEMDGYETTQYIRTNISKELPIVALTASVLDEDKKRALESGMNDFIAKPVRPKEVVQIINQWIEC